VIATGAQTRPEETPGLLEHEWHKSIFDFYTIDGAMALAKHLRNWQGGRMVVNVVENPIKCPVAPLEFLMLADWFFHEQGIRDRVELIYATPLSGAFTKPIAAKYLGDILERKNIKVVPDFMVEHVDPDARKLVHYDESEVEYATPLSGAFTKPIAAKYLGDILERKNIQVVPDFMVEHVDPDVKKLVHYDESEVEYDLLVTIPLNKGDELLARSGMGDELNFVPVDKHTFLSPKWSNVFVLGDAASVPTSKAGSVAHFAVDCFSENFLRYIDGLEMLPSFDGHANCFIESGFGKGLLIDFNYDVEPLPGRYPLPGVGPFTLLQESEMNHWGKMMFRWMYWNILLKGQELPLPARMSMSGKWHK